MMSNSEPLPEGTVIMADNQFEGRGQQESRWHAEPGKNLTFSILLRPSFLAISDQFLLNMAVSNALYIAVKDLVGEGITVKWPNDLYFNDNKIGGMLIENIISGSSIKACIVGIGLNVNQAHFKDGLEGTAGSLWQILHHDVNLIELLAQICSQIEAAYLKLKAGTIAGLRETYLNHLYQYNVMAAYRQNGEIIEGKIIDVSEKGLLSMETRIGLQTYNFKEIEFIKTHKK